MKTRYVQVDLRTSNRKIIYDIMTRVDSVSRAELTRLTGISGATVLKIMDFLVDKKICVYEDSELDMDYQAVGRKPSMLKFNPDYAHTVSVFFEGNYIIVAVLNVKGKIKAFREYGMVDVCDFLNNRLEGVIIELLGSGEFANTIGVGIGLPAMIDIKTGDIIEAPFLRMDKGFKLSKYVNELSNRLKLPVYVENDVNACAYGEYMCSYAQEKDSMVYISVGSGVGCGIILNSKLFLGENRVAGEIGYMIYNPEAAITDTDVSGGWLERRINLSTVKNRMNTSAENSGESSGNQRILRYLADNIALTIANVTAILDVDTVILGGIVVDNFGENLLDLVRGRCFRICNRERSIKLARVTKSGVIGLSYIVAQNALEEILME